MRSKRQDRHYFEETISKMFGRNSNFVFYAHVLAQCKVHIERTLPAPAAVNFENTRYNLFINPLLFDRFTVEERTAILIHEAKHICYNHVTIRMKSDFERWNYAGDIAINQEIEGLPEGCLTPELYGFPREKSAEQYYDALEDNEEYKKQKKEQEQKQKEIEEKIKEAIENGEFDYDGTTPIDDHSKWSESTGQASYQKEVTKRMVEKAYQQTRGNLPSDINKILEVHETKHVVDWRRALRKVTGNKPANKRPDRRRPNRRFPKRMELHGKRRDTTYTIATILDVSGSMKDSDIVKGLAEIREIARMSNSSVKIIQVDAEVKEVEDFDANTKSIVRGGAGGTRMFPGVEYLDENGIEYNALVIITDGWVEKDWPYIPKVPTFWLTTSGDMWFNYEKYKNHQMFDLKVAS